MTDTEDTEDTEKRKLLPMEGGLERAVFDALHAEWHSPGCLPEFCDEFLDEWFDGRDFTADDLRVIIEATSKWERENPVYVEPSTPGYPITGAGGPFSAPGGVIYHKTPTITKTTTTTGGIIPKVPITKYGRPATTTIRSAKPHYTMSGDGTLRGWIGDRKGRLDLGVVTESFDDLGKASEESAKKIRDQANIAAGLDKQMKKAMRKARKKS